MVHSSAYWVNDFWLNLLIEVTGVTLEELSLINIDIERGIMLHDLDTMHLFQ